MKKILFFLTLLCTQIFAETWKESSIFYAWKGDRVYFSDSMGAALTIIDYKDFFEGISLYIRGYSSAERPYGGTLDISFEWTENNIQDSIWISKYWMDDSLRNEPIVVKENLDLSDFRLLNLDSLQFYKGSSIMDGVDSSQFYFVSRIMDDRVDLLTLLDKDFDVEYYGNFIRYIRYNSLYFIYKKKNSYNAYCLLANSSPGPECSFILSCIFQNDGTLNFGEIPTSSYLRDLDGCPLQNLSPSINLKKDNQQTSPLYNAKGKPTNDNSSGVSLQKGVSKVNLKK